MEQYINKSAVVAEIERIKKKECPIDTYEGRCKLLWFEQFLSFLDTLEVKEVELIIHTIITECCDWLAICTDLNHDLIEDCRNLMLAVKDEQLKAQKGK